jgi:hypothetical protein
MKIIWNLSGDLLNLDPINQELAEYWISELERVNQNNFYLLETEFNQSWASELREHIQIIHQLLLNKFKINKFESFIDADFFDQAILNQLHCTWIKTHEEYPTLSILLNKLGTSNIFHWNQINKKLHYIEHGFVCSYRPPDKFWEINNPFGDQLLNFNRCHVQISFSQKGRSTYNKWLNQDYNINDIDTNNFAQIGNEIEINLHRSLIQSPPTNYVDFCHASGFPVVGAYLNLANFSNYETQLANIRHVVARNIADENNTASFKL